jgi:hypothetical protein
MQEFAEAAARAGREARQGSGGRACGRFVDEFGRYLQEHPDGRVFAVRFDPSQPRESHLIIVRELHSPVA